MNVAPPASGSRIEVSVSGDELTEFTRASMELDIAEDQLGRPDVQTGLRRLISGIFRGLGPAVGADARVEAAHPGSTRSDCCVISGMRFHELPYRREKHASQTEAAEPESLLNSTRDGFPHTDSAFKPKPEPLFALFTVRAAEEGGDSLVWNVGMLLHWIAAQPDGAAALAIMRERALPFVGSVLTPEQVIHAPVLLDASGERMRYKRDAIEDAAKALGRALSPEERRSEEHTSE